MRAKRSVLVSVLIGIVGAGLCIALAASLADAAVPTPRFRAIVPVPRFQVRMPLPLFAPRAVLIAPAGQWRTVCGPNGCQQVWVPARRVVVAKVEAVVVPAKPAATPPAKRPPSSPRFFGRRFWGWPR